MCAILRRPVLRATTLIALFASGAFANGPSGLAPFPGSAERGREVTTTGEYRRIVGFEAGALGIERLPIGATTVRYSNPSGANAAQVFQHYANAAEADGYAIDWRCATRQACGSTVRTEWGRGWQGVNGLNPGIAGEVHYFTASRGAETAREYLSVAVTTRYTDLQFAGDAAEASLRSDASTLAAAIDAQGEARLDGLYFETGSATLRPASVDAIAEAARLLEQRPTLALRIIGHTDDIGSEADNLVLSRQRADAVMDALTAHHGIAASRLEAVGRGEAEPVASNESAQGRALNRRVSLQRR
jgi:outer membrane protein OmpA-like peptidoglycan-associated protein